MFKRLIIFIVLGFSVLQGHAQSDDDSLIKILEEKQQQVYTDDNKDSDEADENTDEDLTDTILTIHPIEILPDTIQTWKNKKQFAYVKNLDSLLKALQQEKDGKKPEAESPRDTSFIDKIFNGPLLKLVLWTMAVIFVIVILFQLAKNQGFFKGSIYKEGAREEELPEPEDIMEQDFDKLLRSALSQENYRLAIRYQFLKTLQRLQDKKLIEFAVDKTNSRYVHEIPTQWRNDFASLIMNYEYTWYGNFALSAGQYDFLQKKYLSFNEKI